MLRLALLIIFLGTLVGALMPSSLRSPDVEPPETVRVAALEEGDTNAQAGGSGSGTISLKRQYDGHFYAEAQVNGAPVRFLVDTGASGIALSALDARRAGLATDPSLAKVVGNGASGEVLGHFVRLDRVELGLKSVSDTPAVVLEAGDQSLLGQSFLSSYDSVEIHDDTMVLR